MTLEFWDILLVCCVCVLTAVMAIAASTRYGPKERAQDKEGSRTEVFRIKGKRIVQSNYQFQECLENDNWNGFLSDIKEYFSFRFADLPPDFPDYPTEGEWSYTSHIPMDRAELKVLHRDGVTRFILADPSSDQSVIDHINQHWQHVRLMAQWILDQAPHPKWIIDRSDRISWSNSAYKKLAKQSLDPPGEGLSVLVPNPAPSSYPDRMQNRSLFKSNDGSPDRWFDITQKTKKGLTLFQATDVTAVVKAENAQRAFVQTLTKTFAQLSTGLAIFDRNWRLVLFNPALIDLTSLGAEFLSARPDHLTFFDKLRDESIMPEPRNYATWRDQIVDLISRAENGQYQETWSLTNGRTYRITGRPHPNGAVAFLFEDISAEVTLTRRFREQLDLSQAVMESLDDALAVFSPQGYLSYTNDAYRALWTHTAGEPQLDQSVSEVSQHWQAVCGPDPTWGDFRDFVVGFGERYEWDARVRMQDGRLLDCRFKPLLGGATLATFRITHSVQLREISQLQ